MINITHNNAHHMHVNLSPGFLREQQTKAFLSPAAWSRRSSGTSHTRGCIVARASGNSELPGFLHYPASGWNHKYTSGASFKSVDFQTLQPQAPKGAVKILWTDIFPSAGRMAFPVGPSSCFWLNKCSESSLNLDCPVLVWRLSWCSESVPGERGHMPRCGPLTRAVQGQSLDVCIVKPTPRTVCPGGGEAVGNMCTKGIQSLVPRTLRSSEELSCSDVKNCFYASCFSPLFSRQKNSLGEKGKPAFSGHWPCARNFAYVI